MAGSNIKVKPINNPSSTGFPAIADQQAKILILGSMPSVKSLEKQQYYAHPRNAFWPIMSALFDMEQDLNYQQRCQHLISHHIAVWDVLKSCQRQGSLDQHIKKESIVANDFNTFFLHHPYIHQVFFNGSKAEQVFKQYVVPSLSKTVKQQRLPSTSPAHAAMKFEQKLRAWQLIKLN